MFTSRAVGEGNRGDKAARDAVQQRPYIDGALQRSSRIYFAKEEKKKRKWKENGEKEGGWRT